MDDGSSEFLAGELRNDGVVRLLFDAEHEPGNQPFGHLNGADTRHHILLRCGFGEFEQCLQHLDQLQLYDHRRRGAGDLERGYQRPYQQFGDHHMDDGSG